MWRLKIAEGGNDPYLFSTNNFVGRQTWEYEPEAGTQEERSQVEDARLNFYNNRFKVKPCGDLLWRFQVSIIYSQLNHLFSSNSISFQFSSLISFILLLYSTIN
jgi:hypothetical protein